MKFRIIVNELSQHLPFSILFTAAGLILAALLTYNQIPSSSHPGITQNGAEVVQQLAVHDGPGRGDDVDWPVTPFVAGDCVIGDVEMKEGKEQS